MKSLKVHVLSKLLNRDMLVKVLHRPVLLGSVDDLCDDDDDDDLCDDDDDDDDLCDDVGDDW